MKYFRYLGNKDYNPEKMLESMLDTITITDLLLKVAPIVRVNSINRVKRSEPIVKILTDEGIKYYDTEWHQTNIIDGSFQPCKKNLDGVLFAFSYEGKSGTSKQYGVIYSIDNGKNWSYLKSDNYSYCVYDAAIFDKNINFSQYTDTYNYTKKQGTLNEYSILSVISEGAENKKIYYSEDLEEYYIYDSNNNLQQISGYVISNKTDRLIKPEKIISCTVSISDGNFSAGEFEDELTEDGEKVEDLMGNDIKYYGDTSCIFEDSFLYNGEVSVNVNIIADIEVM
jgi:hypothetical protein